MGEITAIEWTDASWNPLAGCSVLSPGCKRCYAMRMAARIEAMTKALQEKGYTGAPHYVGTTHKVNGNPVWTGKVALAPDHILTEPLTWRAPRRIFVNSMSDLFHEDVPDGWIDRIFAVMALCPQHTFQVLTKRAGRMREYFASIDNGDGQRLEGFRDALIEGEAQALYAKLHPGEDPSMWLAVHMPLPNVWLGVSAERRQEWLERTAELKATPAAVRFVSAEPLLGDLGEIDLNGLDWIIVGGESGPRSRPMVLGWAKDIVRQCRAAGTAVFVKQLGAKPTNREGLPHPQTHSKGADISEFPEELRVRQWPEVLA